MDLAEHVRGLLFLGVVFFMATGLLWPILPATGRKVSVILMKLLAIWALVTLLIKLYWRIQVLQVKMEVGRSTANDFEEIILGVMAVLGIVLIWWFIAADGMRWVRGGWGWIKTIYGTYNARAKWISMILGAVFLIMMLRQDGIYLAHDMIYSLAVTGLIGGLIALVLHEVDRRRN